MDSPQRRSPESRSLVATGRDDAPSFLTVAPAISLPKGGGAIRGIGEKFAANPVTGTGSMSVPIATSPGRSGFGPQLSLSYDSGAGNGPFGFGWSLSLPSITRKTDKGLPQYLDAEDSDVFILSGAEDLVPVYRQDPDGTWVAESSRLSSATRTGSGCMIQSGRLVVHEDELDGYRVRRYRPRIEGLFARIERWTKLGAPDDVHWRSISKDNILTLYGLDANSRIADPMDASRIFSWLICETRDDKGNAVLYRYKAEDGLGVDLGNAHERNRGPQNDVRRTANRYLKRIHYGNRTPLLDNTWPAAALPGHDTDRHPDRQRRTGCSRWCSTTASTMRPRPSRTTTSEDATGALAYPGDRAGPVLHLSRGLRGPHHAPVPARVDVPPLSGRGGRRSATASCARPTSPTRTSVDPTDVRNPVYTFLKRSPRPAIAATTAATTSAACRPSSSNTPSPSCRTRWRKSIRRASRTSRSAWTAGAYRWTDLHGEGIPGILTEQAGAWFYKRNLSPIPDTLPAAGSR